eukprot:SAG31_NODE_1379_length_8582_cov_17.482848_7_plen_67_part_00
MPTIREIRDFLCRLLEKYGTSGGSSEAATLGAAAYISAVTFRFTEDAGERVVVAAGTSLSAETTAR